MESFKFVLPEHLNHYGFLFGGNLLKWVDETAYIAASMEFPGCNFVTVGMDRVEFKKSICQGSILRFDIQRNSLGTTSARYHVLVHARDLTHGHEELVFSTTITFVCVDNCGKKTAIAERDKNTCPLRGGLQGSPQ
jgi:acyl-CoA hydrolase